MIVGARVPVSSLLLVVTISKTWLVEWASPSSTTVIMVDDEDDDDDDEDEDDDEAELSSTLHLAIYGVHDGVFIF